MKKFPYKTMFLCLFLPPVCYVLTLQTLQGYLGRNESAKLFQIVVQDYDALYQGRYPLKEEVNRNINEYLSGSLKEKVGIRRTILVKTKDDRILYPSQSSESSSAEQQLSESYSKSVSYMEVAAENYRTLNEGLVLQANVHIEHNTWLANIILILYVFPALFLLQKIVVRVLRESEQQEKEQQDLIQSLSDQLAQEEKKLGEIESKEKEYLQNIEGLTQDKKGLAEDVDSLLEEIEKQESGLAVQKKLKAELETQMGQIREDLAQLREKSERPKKKKPEEAARKRFTVLYKNLAFTDRAIEGFVELTDEFQLKAEEVIHKVNEDDSAINVKRKVFGKGGKMNILEVPFAYSGRIYYQKNSQVSKTIFAIGTKNTQERDLVYLESVK
jgi:hypothetical protein